MKRFPTRIALGWIARMLRLAVVLAAAGVVVDAGRRRAARDPEKPAVEAVVRLLGTADMALSSASRWLRHPSLSEPGAAFADGPAVLDADPAGALIAPPLPVLAGTGMEPEGFSWIRTTP